MNIDERIAALARAINRQTADLARDKARQIQNIWICEDGEIKEIENPAYLSNKVEDDEKVLSDLLRTLDKLIGERDGNQVSKAIYDTAEKRSDSDSDAPTAE